MTDTRCVCLAGVILLFLTFGICAQTPSTVIAEVEHLATTLIALRSSHDRQQLLATKKELMTPDLRKALIIQGNAQLMAGRYSTAFDIYTLAQNIAAQIGDKEGVATASLDLGTVYYFQADYPAALDHYRKAHELFTEVPNQHESAKALSGVALVYREQRRDAEALTAFQQALKEFTAVADKTEIANTLNSIGAIYYAQGDYSAAAEAFRKSGETLRTAENIARLADALYMQGDYSEALNYYKQTLSWVSPTEIGATIAALHGAANAAYFQGNYDEALRYFERNVRVQSNQQDKTGLAMSLKGIGNVHRSRGDYAAALESYMKSLKISEEMKAPSGATLGSIGLVKALQADYVRALEYYNSARKEFVATSNKIELARVLSLIGNAQYMQGNYEAALESYRQALSLREQMQDKSGQGDVRAGMGSTFLRQQKFSEALDNYHEALALFDSVGKKESTAEVLTRISEAFLLQSDYTRALSAAQSASNIARETDNVDLLWYSRVLEGKAHHKRENIGPAYQAFTDAVSIVESLRSRAPSTSGTHHNSSLPYLSLIDYLLSQHRPGEAFDYAERAKVQNLFDLFRNNNATTFKGLSPAERDEEQRLAGAVASLEMQLDRETQLRTSTEARRSSLRDRLQKARVAYSTYRDRLFVAHPRLRIDRGELPSLKLEELGSLLEDGSTAVLEYVITPNNTYLFVLTSEKKSPRNSRATAIELKVYPLEIKNEELAPKVSRFEQQISSRASDFEETAAELYDLLVKPAEDQISLKSKLVIIPDGLLWRLPFEALESERGRYLVDQMQVSYAPSLTALRELQKQRVSLNSSSRFAAFGNPTLSAEFNDRVNVGYSETRLESSLDQAEEIKRSAAGYAAARPKLFTGADASEDRFRSEASQSTILHFATPVVLDETSPLSSFIGLAPGTGERNEGFLQAREIVNVQTNAQLIVMSGARRHGNHYGSATPALSWSWFVAGSSTMMLNRWSVEPDIRLRLLSQFYSLIRPKPGASLTKAASLHRSVMSLRRSREYEHPYYWAGFAIIGDEK